MSGRGITPPPSVAAMVRGVAKLSCRQLAPTWKAKAP